MATGSNPASNSNGASFNNSIKVEKPNKLDFFKLYEEIGLNEPYLMANMPLWSRKGNGKKYICSLCNITVEINKNRTIFKTSILSHINSSHHKKRFAVESGVSHLNELAETQGNKESKMKCVSDYKESLKKEIFKSGKINHLDGGKMAGINSDEHDAIFSYMCNQEVSIGETGVQSIYDSLTTGNSVTMASKKYISKNASDENLLCTLCDMLILFSPNPNELRYNIWSHIHGGSHRSKLTNHVQVFKEFNKQNKKLLKIIRKYNEEKYFEVGPHPYLVKCTLCTIAVSTNPHRLENHICGKGHIDMKNPIIFEERLLKWDLSSRIIYKFNKLMCQIDLKFNEYKHSIQAGVLPGYVVCVDCCSMVLSTKFYLESHLELDSHIKNSLLRPVIPAEITVRDLVRKLPAELKGSGFFYVISCGLRCKICKFLCPATAYDMYTHIVGHKHETQLSKV